MLEENKIYAESVSERYLAYRRLEVLERLAKSPNTKWVPFEALGTVGQSVAAFRTGADAAATGGARPVQGPQPAGPQKVN